MAIVFPEGVDGAKFYVPDSDLVLQYDESTNSWNIVGPDNLATIEYVDQTIATDATKTYRNSALHKETNLLGVDATKSATFNQYCNNNATSSFSGDLKFDPETEFPLGQKDWNSPEYLIATGHTIPEWHSCVEQHVPPGTFTYIGHDLETSNASSELRYILAFSLSTKNPDGSDTKLEPIIPGDTFEIYLDSTKRAATSEVKFALYEVKEVYRSTNNLTVSVLFLDSNTPTENIQMGFTYDLYSYGSALEKTGGTLDGDLKIVNHSETTFEVYKNEDDIGPNNEYNLVFKVDTFRNDVTVNEIYNNNRYLTTQEFDKELNPLSVATVGYVNTRLGLVEDHYYRTDDGPYLKISGGSVGYINILNDGMGGTQNFVVRGIKNDVSVKDEVILASLNNTQNSNKTEVRYYGPMSNDLELVTKKYVDNKAAGSIQDLSPYLKSDGSRKPYGQLTYSSSGSNKPYLKSKISDYDDYDIPAAKAIKAIQVATVKNGASSDKGVLYETGGVLYYNTYS